MTDLSEPPAGAASGPAINMVLSSSVPAAMHTGALAQVGIGWRQPHYAGLIEARPALGFIEVHSENFFADGGAALAVLQQGRAHWPVSLHGVGLGLGSAAGLDDWHLDRLARLVQRIDPVRVSDHAAFARASRTPLTPRTPRAPRTPAQPVVHGSDLLPLAFTDAGLDILVANVQRVQDRLRRPILVENLSAYLHWADDSLAEAEFFNALTRRSGCGLLLDVNNLVVNALNAGLEPVAATAAFIDAINPDSVGEIHLAGYCQLPDIVIDDHGSRVHPPVWRAYAHAIRRLGPRPTLIEWDTDLPPLDVLLAEAAQAAAVMAVEAGPAKAVLDGLAPWTRPAQPGPASGQQGLIAGRGHALEAQRQQLLVGGLFGGPVGGLAEPPAATPAPAAAAVDPAASALPAESSATMAAPTAQPGSAQDATPAPTQTITDAHAHLTGWLRGNPTASRRGLVAYRANGLAAAERALAAAYPTLALMVGDEALAGLAHQLWRQRPPDRGDLACWGAGLAGLISTQPWLADWPWLPDMARLDWAVHQCEAAADAPADPLNLQALAADDAAEHVLLLRPGTALINSRWPLVALWQAHRLPPGQQADAAHAALAHGTAESALVCRGGPGHQGAGPGEGSGADTGEGPSHGAGDRETWRATVSPLAEADARFVAAVLQGQTLGQALAAAGDDFNFEPWLLTALRLGWISQLQPTQPTI